MKIKLLGIYNIARRKKIAHNCTETFAVFEKNSEVPYYWIKESFLKDI